MALGLHHGLQSPEYGFYVDVRIGGRRDSVSLQCSSVDLDAADALVSALRVFDNDMQCASAVRPGEFKRPPPRRDAWIEDQPIYLGPGLQTTRKRTFGRLRQGYPDGG